MNRFIIEEHVSGFSIVDTKTGQSHWLSDGVDLDFGTEDKPLTVGMSGFREAWEKDVNNDPDILEAYFPEQFEKES